MAPVNDLPRTAATPAPTPSPPWPATRVLVGLGATHIILGGLIAAVTGPLDLSRGSWLAAYLVLVGGVAQYAMGRAPSWLARPITAATGWAQVAGWNAGNAAVIAGTLAATPLVVDLGAVVLVAVLVMHALALLRPAQAAGSAGHQPGTARLTRWAYTALLVVLIASAPVGMILAHLRTG